MDRDEDTIHRRVARTYSRIADGEPDCCEATCQNSAANLVDYNRQEIAGLPADAATRSCGCGSPVSVSDLQAEDIVLDLGSGVGLDLLIAARTVGPKGRVIGVDVSDAMVSLARDNAAAAGLGNVEVRRGLIEDLPIDDESVDWVISNCVINLSPSKPRVFAEIARVLRPGGRMTVADIVAEDLPEWVRHSDDLYDSCVAGAINEAEYVAGLHAAGLIDISVGGRYVYNRDQLAGTATGAHASRTETSRVADALVGRVWSAHFSAIRPDTDQRDLSMNEGIHAEQPNRPEGEASRDDPTDRTRMDKCCQRMATFMWPQWGQAEHEDRESTAQRGCCPHTSSHEDQRNEPHKKESR